MPRARTRSGARRGRICAHMRRKSVPKWRTPSRKRVSSESVHVRGGSSSHTPGVGSWLASSSPLGAGRAPTWYALPSRGACGWPTGELTPAAGVQRWSAVQRGSSPSESGERSELLSLMSTRAAPETSASRRTPCVVLGAGATACTGAPDQPTHPPRPQPRLAGVIEPSGRGCHRVARPVRVPCYYGSRQKGGRNFVTVKISNRHSRPSARTRQLGRVRTLGGTGQ